VTCSYLDCRVGQMGPMLNVSDGRRTMCIARPTARHQARSTHKRQILA